MTSENSPVAVPVLPMLDDARDRYQAAQQLWVAMGRPDRGELFDQMQRFRALFIAVWRRDNTCVPLGSHAGQEAS